MLSYDLLMDSKPACHDTEHSTGSGSKRFWTWKSSPYLSLTGSFLVNLQMAHGVLTSGMVITQYERMCEGAKLGTMNRQIIQKVQTDLLAVCEQRVEDSINNALLEAVAGKEGQGIDIESDVRHSAFKGGS